MAATHLTEGRIKALRPRKTTRDIRDASLKGFGVRVYPSGRKRYFLHTQHDGQRVWKIVGDASGISLAEARRCAQAMLVGIRNGAPSSSDETLFEMVAEEVFQRYGRTWKPRTLYVNQGYYRQQLLPWFRERQISEITCRDVQEWFVSLHATPVAADRSAPVLSVIMARAEDYGYRPEGSNPCKGIRRYRRQGRERFCSVEEVRRLGRVLQGHEARFPAYVAVIRLLLLTGCRRQEIVSLRWTDYREGHLYLSDSKTGPRMVWLSSPARQILKTLPRCSSWVFPSARTTARSMSDSAIGHFWMRVQSDAGLKDVRLHDLRHTYASLAVMQGTPLPVVAKLLGHSKTTMTLRYAHTGDRETEAAAERIGTTVSELLGIHATG